METINKKLALKVKVKHLAEEARIIRFEEGKTNGVTRDWLHNHRLYVVRPEARATQIAYAFAKGTPLRAVEKYPERIPLSVWSRVTKMVKLYSDKPFIKYGVWLDAAGIESQ
ncbi:MAG: hypothetical protein GWN00_14810 [Aliifodinibius sp.]|nr:hypothetical protein [Fodinibius sp.]NIY26030.1 hypothetical protein [Fodinibius sp.]